MNPAYGYAFGTMLLLGIAIGVMGGLFRTVSSEYAITIIYGVGLFFVVPLSFGLARMDGLTLVPPGGIGAIVGIAVCGVLIAFADYCGQKAFNSGANILLVSAMIAAAPAVATLVGVIATRELPRVTDLVGTLLLIAAVALIRSGHPEPAAPAAQTVPADTTAR